MVILSRIKHGLGWLFHQVNHGSHAARDAQVSQHLSPRMSDANSEAKMGPPPTSMGPM